MPAPDDSVLSLLVVLVLEALCAQALNEVHPHFVRRAYVRLSVAVQYSKDRVSPASAPQVGVAMFAHVTEMMREGYPV
jgi:hypothetical protein